MICRITFGVKWAGARSAGIPHTTCDRAGAGNGATDGLRHQHNGESRWSTATPLSCRHRASPRPYRDDSRFRQLLDTVNEILREEITSLRPLVDNFSAFAILPKVEPLPVDLVDMVTELVRMQPEWQEPGSVVAKAPSFSALCDKLLFRRLCHFS